MQSIDVKSKNPFAGGLFETNAVNYLPKDGALKLINTLESKLALSIKGSDVTADYIFRKTTGHPALIQHFLSNLVRNISKRVDDGDRMIYKADIEKVAKAPSSEEGSFIEFADRRFFLNLRSVDAAVICVMAELSEEYKNIPKLQIFTRLNEKLEDFQINMNLKNDKGFPSTNNPDHWVTDGSVINIASEKFKDSLKTLSITQLVMEDDNFVSFKESFWKDFLLNKLTDNLQDAWYDIQFKTAIHEVYVNENALN
jgi:hypothetical protein